jgi:hypothetical protein
MRALFLAVCAGVLAAPASPADSPDEIVGQTITGGAMATETVADIMARDALLPAVSMPLRAMPEHAFDHEKEPNPEAPDVAQWPPARGVKAGEARAQADERAPQPLGVDFQAIQASEAGFIPPDSMGAVGPTQLMVVANGRIKVFSKAGALGGLNTSTENFFASVGGVTNGTSDPHIRYDRLSGRWFVVIITVANCPNNVLVAVSSGPVITSQTSFAFFSFAPETSFIDYPTLGVDRNALYIGGNVFTCPGAFSTVSAYVVRKSALLTGSLVFTRFTGLQTAGIWTPQGVDNDEPSAAEGYFIGVDFNVFSRLGIRRVSTPGGTPTLSAQINLTVPTTVFPILQPQPTIAATLDPLDDRLFAAAIHRNKITGAMTLWTGHNIQVNASGVGSNSGGRNGSRWYEIGNLTTTPTLVQSGTLFDSAGTTPFGFWIPTVMGSGQGHMAIASSRASASAAAGGFASVIAAGRLRTDGLGTTRGPTLVQGSGSTYDQSGGPPERWGDYSQTVVDPVDDQTMWTFQEYANATNSWAVRATQLRAPPPATPATANPATVPPGQFSATVVVNGTSTAGSEFFDPGPDAGGPGFASRMVAAVSGGVLVTSVTFNSPTQVTLNISTVGTPTGAKSVTLTNPDGQSRTGVGILTVGGCPIVAVNPANIPSGTTGSPYSQTFTQSGGSGTVTWSLSGTLPTGMSFDTTTGVLSGTPTQTGTFSITVTATDGNGCPGGRPYTLVVNRVAPFTATALTVDAAGNSVFEAGETAVVAPSWRNDTGASDTVTGAASSFTGPGTTTYTINDATAGYGTVGIGGTANCSSASGNCYGFTVAAPLNRHALHWDSTFTETLSNADAKAWTLHIGDSFADVPRANGFYRFVETLLHHGITGGCSVTTYCPSAFTLREQMAVFVLVAKDGVASPPPACTTPLFSDVPAASPFCRYIEELSRRGVVSGCGGGAYCPGSPVTREQMSVFVLRTFDPALDPPACGTPMFSDVPASGPFCRWIEELARRGVVGGCGAGNYCPTQPVTREQMGVFIGVTFGLTLYGP